MTTKRKTATSDPWHQLNLLQKASVTAQAAGWCAAPDCVAEVRRGGGQWFCNPACHANARRAWSEALQAVRDDNPKQAEYLDHILIAGAVL